MKGKTLEMNRKELDRVRVIHAVCERQLTQREAAAQLELSIRQVKRLAKRYRKQGAEGLVSGHRGHQRPEPDRGSGTGRGPRVHVLCRRPIIRGGRWAK